MPNYRAVAAQFARKYGLNPRVFTRQIQQESGFNPNARSPAGAQGIAQIMPGTAASWHVNAADPTAALDAAARHMAQYVHQYGNYRDALIAYNAGPGAVGRGSLPAETRNYIATILGGSNPSAGGVRSAGAGSTTTTTSTTSLTPDAQQARRSALAQFVLSSGAGDPLKLAEAYAGAGSQTQTTRKVRATGGAAGAVAGSSGYVDPFGASLKAPGRVDEGVDPVIQGPIRAIGDARVVNISHNFYKGQPYIVYQLTSGPHKGRYVYVSELVTPHVAVGQRLRAGDVVATGHGAIETGWAGGASGSFLPLANRAQGGNYTEGKATGHGQAFAQFLRSLGANAAR